MGGLDFYINTKDVSSGNALSYWNEYVCEKLIALNVSQQIKQQDFYGIFQVHQLDTIQVCKVTSRDNSVCRTKSQITKSTDDYFIVNLQMTGESIVRQDGRVVCLKPNDLTFTDSTRPYHLESKNEFELLALKIPRDLITFGTSYITSNTARLLTDSEGLGNIVKNFILSLSNDLNSINSETRKYLANTLVHLLNDYLNAKFVSQKNNSPSQEMMVFRIKSYIKEHITDPQLSVEYIAKAFNCSKRQLHHIFNYEKLTVNNYIRETRLQKCKNDIENQNLSKLTIAEIGYKNGFNDIGNFVKLFKHKFAVPPGGYRNLYLQSYDSGKLNLHLT